MLSQVCPRGRAWDAKEVSGSNVNNLLKSLATEILTIEEKLYELVSEWDINFTTNLINEWEKAVGIPDQCRDKASTLVNRRTDVITKLKKVPTITVADYKTLAETITGQPAADWNIRPGYDDFPTDPLYKFVLLVTAPVVTSGAFTYPFGSGTLPVTSLTSIGTLCTATVSSTSTMTTGNTVTIVGANETEYNGDFTITVTGGTTFTYNAASTPSGSPATGTITVNYGITQAQVDSLAGNTQFMSLPDIAFSGYPFAGSFRTDVLQCVFRKITPASVAIVWD